MDPNRENQQIITISDGTATAVILYEPLENLTSKPVIIN